MQAEIKAVFDSIEARDFDLAEKRIDKLLKRKPLSSHFLYIRGMIAKEIGDLITAETYIEKAIKYDIKNYPMILDLATVKLCLKKTNEALKLVEAILKNEPNNTDVLLSLAQIYSKLKINKKSKEILMKLLSIEPKHDLGLYLLSLNYYEKLDYKNAVNLAIEALEVNSNLPYMRVVIADYYVNQENKFSLGMKLLEEEIQIHPASTNAYRMIGSCLARIGDVKAGIEYTKKQLEITPNCNTSRSNLLTFIQYLPDIAHEEIKQVALDYYKYCCEDKIKDIKAYEFKQKKDLKLKLGFVSGDLRKHAVYYWVKEFFAHLYNEEDIEIYCYSNNKEDECSEKLKKSITKWHNIMNLKDKEVADLIYEEKIDILFDLSGHTAKNRLDIFLYKAAPIQVTWLGQSGPMGLPQIDYMLSTDYLVRDGEEYHYTEKVYKLANCFAPYGTEFNDVEIKESPYKKNGYITFACFNNLMKVSPRVLETWVKILKQVPNSRLHLKSHPFDDPIVVNKYTKFFMERGIEEERIILEPYDTDRTKYMLKYNEVDIALDPYPVGGGTTTNDLLYMGIALISLEGKRMCHRISSSMLKLIDCNELIAMNEEEYIQKAVDLANDTSRIDLYKKTLREKYLNSPQVNSYQFSQDFIKACKEIMLDC